MSKRIANKTGRGRKSWARSMKSNARRLAKKNARMGRLREAMRRTGALQDFREGMKELFDVESK